MHEKWEGLSYRFPGLTRRLMKRAGLKPFNFPGFQDDIYLGDDGFFFRMKRHKEHPRHCVRYFNSLLTSADSVATHGLSTCKGIFLLFPDGLKGVIHLWPMPEAIVELKENTINSHPDLSFKDTLAVVLSSNERYVAKGLRWFKDSPKVDRFDFQDLGLDTFYSDLQLAFPDIIIDPTLFFTHEFISRCTIELDAQGFRIFDATRIVDKNNNMWYVSQVGDFEKRLFRLDHVLQEVNDGLSSLNQTLKLRGLIH